MTKVNKKQGGEGLDLLEGVTKLRFSSVVTESVWFLFSSQTHPRTGEVLSHKSDWLTLGCPGLAKTHLLGSSVVNRHYATGGASE